MTKLQRRLDGLPPKDATTTAWRLHYAAIGWYTLLVHGIGDDTHCTCGNRACAAPGKHPVFSGRDRGATLDRDQIRREGAKYPLANVGVHLGKSLLLCIDVDPRNGGNETLGRTELINGPLDAACVANTGGGGTHHFFVAPKSEEPVPRKNMIGAGIDVLHGNAYPIVAPSKHASGQRYQWQKDADPWSNGFLLCPVPTWIGNRSDLKSVCSEITSDDDWVLDLRRDSGSEWTAEIVTTLREALAVVPSGDREMWLRMGAAIHHASGGSEEGRELWDEWSQGSSKFKGCPEKYDDDEQDRTWHGFDGQREGGVRIASIFYEAKARGWTNAASKAAPDTLGDISYGRKFAAKYAGRLLYVHGSGRWLIWDRVRWAPCDRGQEIEAAKGLADELLSEAGQALAQSATEANRRRHTLALNIHRSLHRHHAFLEAARSESGIGVSSPTALDADPWLLGVRNGVVDLRRGKLLPAQPSQLITKQAGADFDPSASCPRWERFMSEVFSSPDVIAFVQRLIGYTLTGSVDEEILIFMYGTGANGKSVFANVLSAILGGYAVTVGTELLAKNRAEGETARFKAKLHGARLALANEVGQGDTWDDQRLKEITSREAIPARMLYHEPFEFMPTHTLWVRGNHQPTILDASDGMWRRLIMLPFSRQFAPDERIPGLEGEILESEAAGILAWAVRGCIEWQRTKLRVPPSISAATRNYRSESDVIGQWRAERTVVEEGGRLPAATAYGDWRVFCGEIGITPGAQPMFTKRLIAAGVAYRKSNGKGYFSDLGLRQDDESDDL